MYIQRYIGKEKDSLFGQLDILYKDYLYVDDLIYTEQLSHICRDVVCQTDSIGFSDYINNLSKGGNFDYFEPKYLSQIEEGFNNLVKEKHVYFFKELKKRLIVQSNDYKNRKDLSEQIIVDIEDIKESLIDSIKSDDFVIPHDAEKSLNKYEAIYFHCRKSIPNNYNTLIDQINNFAGLSLSDNIPAVDVEIEDVSIDSVSEVVVLMNELGIIDFLKNEYSPLNENMTHLSKIISHFTSKNPDTLRRAIGDMGTNGKNDPYNNIYNKNKTDSILIRYGLADKE